MKDLNINLEKENLINELKKPETVPKEILFSLKSFVENNFIKEAKKFNNKKFIIFYILGFNLVFLLFALLGLDVSIKTLIWFVAINIFVAGHVYFFQFISNQKYEEKIILTDEEIKKMKEWLEKQTFENNLQKEVVKILALESYLKNNEFNFTLLNKDCFYLTQRENEKEKILNSLKD